MKLMLDHVDSPYIRCIGFLYLRYAADPNVIWHWFEQYLYDSEMFRISANVGTPEITVGEYVRMLLTEMEYYGTRLSRLPVSIERDIKVRLLQAEQIKNRAQEHFRDSRRMKFFQVGSRIRALYGDEENPVTWYDAVIDKVIFENDELPPSFVVTFPEYGNTENVSLGEIDIPGNEFERYAKHSHDSRDYNNSLAKRNSEQMASKGNQGHKHQYSQAKSHAGNGRHNIRHPPEIHHHSSEEFNEQNLMQKVLRQEREKSAAKGRAYAARPATFKESISHSNDYGQKRQRTHSPESTQNKKKHPDEGKNFKSVCRANDGLNMSAQTKKKTPQELAAIEEKKRKLIARYG
eukprot:CAMPEP_0184863202 /NCGR_PEP_ID=MMETSP0580-20130426/9782_1 /TAXON_ID=1118495 /ORGANISM="Dactyliosolen fragilissimus" /LENGTH=347 /DNA_ID=CAMNT_0027361393 /DNA_START=489 /DNA_END=1532 /DNA_ORIENTATION=+